MKNVVKGFLLMFLVAIVLMPSAVVFANTNEKLSSILTDFKLGAKLSTGSESKYKTISKELAYFQGRDSMVIKLVDKEYPTTSIRVVATPKSLEIKNIKVQMVMKKDADGINQMYKKMLPIVTKRYGKPDEVREKQGSFTRDTYSTARLCMSTEDKYGYYIGGFEDQEAWSSHTDRGIVFTAYLQNYQEEV